MIVAHADASFKNGHVGIGYQIYKPPSTDEPSVEKSKHELLTASDLTREYTSVMAEYLACIKAARAALDHDVDVFVLKTDCMAVVRKIQRRETLVEDGFFRDTLLSILNEFDIWRVSWIDRDLNWAAHEQAKKALRSRDTGDQPLLPVA